MYEASVEYLKALRDINSVLGFGSYSSKNFYDKTRSLHLTEVAKFFIHMHHK